MAITILSFLLAQILLFSSSNAFSQLENMIFDSIQYLSENSDFNLDECTILDTLNLNIVYNLPVFSIHLNKTIPIEVWAPNGKYKQ